MDPNFTFGQYFPERLSVSRSHVVVDKEIDGGVHERRHVQQPKHDVIHVVVPLPRFQILDEKTGDPEEEIGEEASDEQAGSADQHTRQRHLSGR